VTIGTASFAVRAGAKTKVTIRLSKAARTYLQRHKRLRASIAVVLLAGGSSKTTRGTLVIKRRR
jgi:hypothetical protein